ncbi:hypothetical protein [uncultured Ferrimonas sp.]|uniref:hypothetical protein n=1 Tax=uncultured Ferrimonas sp. TaxID=432640 RepID=UPI0026333C63|nr:hypothetical protein [uncultured Ferrimonas sp.]
MQRLRRPDGLQKLFLLLVLCSYAAGASWGLMAGGLSFGAELLFAVMMFGLFLLLAKLVVIRARRRGDNYIRVPILVAAVLTILLIQYRFIYVDSPLFG